MASLRGEPVDRPPVCFYEINGLDEHADDPDPYNIYNHPSWAPLIALARDHSDRTVMRSVAFDQILPDPAAEQSVTRTWEEGSSRYTHITLKMAGRCLTARTRRDRDVNTVWHTEHLLKDADDLRAYLTLPPAAFGGVPAVEPVHAAEAALGDSGIVMLDTPDPLCLAAALFDLGTYTVIALTEPALFTDLLERFAAWLLPRTEAIAAALPGRLWRIVGPEYATPPYLPPRLFREYVIPYVEPMVRAIQRHGGYARVHCHGRIRDVLDDIVGMNPDGLDPIEPPPQGDVSLAWVRARCGDRVTLFGNIEASDLENLPEAEFRAKVRQALAEGPGGRGFVLMPSACPYGRVLSARALRNYEVMVEEAEA
jgi:hypothetical protein